LQLKTLELYCTLAEHRSFSKAAAVHQLTQSAVSQAMQQLEESLGVQLIDRSKRPLVLTAAGKTYLQGARGILGSYQRLQQEVVSISRRLHGRVTVGTIYSVGLSYMPEATETFARMHPGVEVMTEFGSNARVFEMTAGGEVDFGLVSFPRGTSQLQFIPWQQEPMKLVCASDHPWANRREIALIELSGIAMVGFARELELRQEIDKCLAHRGVKANVRMEFDNCDSMIRAIQANHGIGIVPEAAARRETASGSLRVLPCRELRMTRPLGFIFQKSGRLSTAANEFASLLLGRPIESQRRAKPGGPRPSINNSVIDPGGGTSIVA